jgi:2-methylcitrate dehydratase PrpD
LTEQALQADDIERIAIGCSQMTFVHTVWPYKPASVTAAQMNLSCGLAVIALYRDASVNQDAVQLLAAPAVLGFIERICAHKASGRPGQPGGCGGPHRNHSQVCRQRARRTVR